MTETTLPTNAPPTVSGMCLVCGHTGDDHASDARVCSGVDGLCQCHAYSPDEHPAQRLAAKRQQDRQAAAD